MPNAATILAADTSGKQGSIALANCAPGGSCDALEVVALTGGTFSAQLVPQIVSLLSRHAMSKDKIHAFAVVSGPGSFTGLRVGLAAIKALAEVLKKPIAAVSLLEAVASMSKAEGTVTAVLDAGRRQVYVGEFDKREQCKKIRERLLTMDEFLAESADKRLIGADQEIIAAARNTGLQITAVDRPGAEIIAQIGWRKILAGETVSPDMLEANYIRRSDAEIFAKASPSKITS